MFFKQTHDLSALLNSFPVIELGEQGEGFAPQLVSKSYALWAMAKGSISPANRLYSNSVMNWPWL
jgi:hypothetical protein